MILGDLDPVALEQALREGTLCLQTGPFRFRIGSRIEAIAAGLRRLYAHYPVELGPEYADFYIRLDASGGLRRWYRPQVLFRSDGQTPFKPLPLDQAFAMMEWGMNWCVSTTAHHFLILHSAVLEKNGAALVMPAPPGSGKSTLCAGLHAAGWRLFSDELALIDIDSLRLQPIPRPISLKNESIQLVQRRSPHLAFGRIARDTLKGTVAHLRPVDASIERQDEPAPAGLIVYPRYVPGAPVQVETRPRAHSLIDIAENAFNYNAMGADGFDAFRRLVGAVDSIDFDYSDLDEAIAWFDAAARRPGWVAQ